MTFIYVLTMFLNMMFGGSYSGQSYNLTADQFSSIKANSIDGSSYSLNTSGSVASGNGNIVVVITDQNEF
jgi:hypothetical protein